MTSTPHPRLPGELWQPGDPLADTEERWPTDGTRRPYDDGFVAVRVETVHAPDGDTFDRSVVEHRGAVGILALDDTDRVLLLRQYRHAAGRRLLELPAGVCDVDDEAPVATAARELHEEASLRAADWRLLLEVVPTPGSSTERWQVFLARDLSPVAPSQRHEPQHEEADMSAVWVPLAEAVAAVVQRRLSDGMTGIAALAAHHLHCGAGLETLPAAPRTAPRAHEDVAH